MYNSLAELYLKQGKGKEAFFIIDKARSRNTKSNLNRLKLLAHLKNESEYKQLIDLQWMITSGLYDKSVTDSLDQLLADFTKNLSSRSKELEALLNSDYSLDISELQKGFTDDDYIISVYVSDEFLTLFSLSSANFNFKTLPINRDSLIAMLQSVSPVYQSDLESQEIYINEDLFSFNALASFKLYNSVFKDFLVSIPKNSNLIFNLPTELLKFPVEMLVTEWRTGESPYLYSDKSFLLNDYKISYSPSSTIYIMQNYNSVNVSDQNLLIGDPYIMDSEYSLSVRSGLLNINPTNSRSISLSPLKYSKNEIESIDETINSNLIFKSEEATETNFKNNAHQSNVIHISTHSFLIKDQPLILFANQNDGQDDGFLELGEIVQLNLNSDLVVLSSCRSGLGRLDEAEGIIGMQKAFFDAGSKSVLVSLWDVNDKYTSFFMKDFYTHLANGKSKTEALRQTKLDFIKNYSANPYYWSAFVLSGNSSPINIEQASPVSIVNVLTILLLASIIYFIFSRIRSRKSR
ncbi:MAG: CHAT domain-containing protein [Ignavibacteriaceae bacterium]|nr:CHAT domain-containing protein [Ignavibacteriaceae bacterium]